MKKLLLTLGSVASIVAPVASVVACGTEVQEDTTITREISSTKTQKELSEVKAEDIDEKDLSVVLTTLGLRTDSNIAYEEEFSWIPEKLELTGSHVFSGRKAITIYTIIPVPDVPEHIAIFNDEITKLNDALKDADTFTKVQVAVKVFNDTAVKAPTDMAFADDIVEANQFANKQVKAQLFFQQDNAGSATFVVPDATDAPTNAETGVGMVDTTEVGHKINGVGKFGVRLVPSDQVDPATDAPTISAFKTFVTLANVITDLTKK